MATVVNGEYRALANPYITTAVSPRKSLSVTPNAMARLTENKLREADGELNAMLRTPIHQVYQMTKDGTTYLAPATLRGTPTTRMDEAGPYWKSGWKSLTKILQDELVEVALTEEWAEKKKQNRLDGEAKNKHKKHQDNVSGHRKIREIFGNALSPYHPNQIVSKEYLPGEGLCDLSLLYRLALKISKLRVLHDRGEMSMNPWDFLRWRINEKVGELVDSPDQGERVNIGPIIRNIGDERRPGKAGTYYDPLLHKAMLRVVEYQKQNRERERAAIPGPQNARNPNSNRQPTNIQRGSAVPQIPTLASFQPTSGLVAHEQYESRRRRKVVRRSTFHAANPVRILGDN